MLDPEDPKHKPQIYILFLVSRKKVKKTITLKFAFFYADFD